MSQQINKLVYAIFSTACIVCTGSPVSANPYGANVVHGNAQISHPSSNTLQVDSSGNTIINWQGFSIDRNETTLFNQASASHAVLNRVTGPDTSSILGNLKSNGHVFLINPNGIVIGEHARIDTNSFLASTLDISNQDFLNGKLNFAGDNAGTIANRGFVTAGAGGEIIFVAPQIENHGVLTVEDGRILLAAGEKVTISSLDLAGIEFEIQAPENSVLNIGELIARRGSVGVFAGSIKHEGIIEANSISTDATGNIVLQAQSDIELTDNATISASGSAGGDITIQSETGTNMISGTVEAVGIEANGGEIALLGERVGLINKAAINASGTTEGGEVLVGGDYRGENPAVQNADATFMGADASITADATEDGDGGRIIVWGTDAARVYGQISARGAGYGNGGFVETSGHYLDVTNAPDLSSPLGGGGSWLLDPYNVDIDISVGTLDGQSPNFQPGAPFSTISSFEIENVLLNAGTVTIDTNAAAGTEAGNVNFNVPISVVEGIGTGVLNVNADGDININNSISAGIGSSIDISFLADRNADGVGGTINFVSGVNTNAGSIFLNAPAGIDVGAGVTINSNNGQIDFVTANGNINLIDQGNVAFVQSGAGAINMTAPNGIVLVQGFSSIVSGGAGGNIRLEAKDVELGLNGTINAGRNNVDLILNEAVWVARNAGSTQLLSTELQHITADTLTIASDAGNLRIDQVIGPLNFTNLNLSTSADVQFIQGPGQTAIDLSGGTVNLNVSAGQILDNSNGAADIIANALNVTARDGIKLQTDVANLSYNNTTSGVVDIHNDSSGALTITSGANAGSGTTLVRHTFGGLPVAGNGFNINGPINQGTGDLTFESIGLDGNMSVNSDITLGGNGSFIVAEPGQSFTLAAGNIINAAGDIQISADNIDLGIGSSINPGIAAEVILNRASAGDWFLGSDLTEAELNSITGAIAIGGSNIANLDISTPLALSNNQDLLITITGTLGFTQSAGNGITGANLVQINANQVINGFTGNLDIAANQLDITTVNGIGSAVALETQVNQLVATNSAAGSINIDNSGSNLEIIPAGVQNLATAVTDNITISNTGGAITVNGLVSAQGGSITLDNSGSTADIVVNTDILAPGSGASLTLISARDLVLNSGTANATTFNLSTTSGVVNNSLGVTDFSGNSLTVAAGTGINLDTDVAVLSYSNATSGNIHIFNTTNAGPLTINASSNTGIGSTLVRQTYTGTGVNGFDVSGLITQGAGDLFFESPSNGGAMTINSGISAEGNITLDTAGSAADLSVFANIQSSGIGANLTLDAGRDLIINSGLATADTFYLSAAGAVVNNSTAGADFSGGNLNVEASNGINLETDISSLRYNNTASGNIQILNTTVDKALSIVSGSNAGIGSTLVRQTFAGSVGNGFSIDGAISQNMGNLTFESVSLDGAIEVNSAITAQGNVALDNTGSGSNITLTGGILVSGSGNSLTLTSDLDLLMNGGTAQADTINVITGSGAVVNNSIGVVDFIAGTLNVNANSGIGSVNAIETRVNELIAANQVSGSIAISNSGSGLSIGPTGVRNLAIGATDNIVINNTGGAVTVNDRIDATGGLTSLTNVGVGADIIVNSDIDGANTTLQADEDIVINNGGLIIGGTADLTSSGGAVINNSVGIADVVANTLDVSASNGINLDTDSVANLSYNNSTGGNVQILNTTSAGSLAINASSNTGIGSTTISQAAGDLSIANTLSQGAGDLQLNAITGGIRFDQGTNTGINATGQVQLAASTSVLATGSTGTDVIANILDLQAEQGIGSAGPNNALTTQVSQLSATNGGITPSGAILINNSVTDLSIEPGGVQNLATATTDNINIFNTGGSVTVNGLVFAQGGDISLSNSGSTSDTVINTDIIAQGSGADINLHADRDLILNGTSIGSAGVQVISDTGSIDLSAANNLSLLAGSQPDEFIEVLAGGTLYSGSNNLLVQGGTAQNTSARLVGLAGARLGTSGNVSLLGGNATNSEATINADGFAYVYAGGDLLLTAGSGAAANALISNHTAGVSLNVTVEFGGDVTLTGGSGLDAVAAIGSTDASMSIDLGREYPIGGDLNLIAGTGGRAAIGANNGLITDTINIEVAGSLNMQSNGSNPASIGYLAGGGDITVKSGAGFGNTEGGDLNINNGFVSTGGVLSLDTTGGTLHGGDIVLNGGGLLIGSLTANAAGAILMQKSGISASNNINLISGGDIQIAGGTAVDEWSELMAGNVFNLDAGNNLILQGGSELNTMAQISGATGVTVTSAGDIQLLGGTGDYAEAIINSDASVNVVAGGNIVFTAGGGVEANAAISNGFSQSVLSVVVDAVGDITLTGGSGLDAVAAIGTDNANVNVTLGSARRGPIGGDLNIIAGTGGLAGIGAIEIGQADTITIDLAGSLNMQSNASYQAFIGSATGGGDIRITTGSGSTAGGNIGIGSRLTTAGDLYLTAIAGTLNNGDILLNGDVTIAASNTFISANQVAVQSGTTQLSTAATLDVPFNVVAGTVNLPNTLTLNGAFNNAGTVAVAGTLAVNGLTTNTGTLNIQNALTLNNVLDNSGTIGWAGTQDILGNGTFNNLSDGTFSVVNSQTFAPTFNNAGLVLLTNSTGATTFAGGYSQSAGSTVLQNSAMDVTGQFDLLGGNLSGAGTITTTLLNNTGGIIAPGAVGIDSVSNYSILNIVGNLSMGNDATIQLDLGGSDLPDRIGSGAGEVYDALQVSGDLGIGGNLVLAVAPDYRARKGDSYRLLTFNTLSGDRDNLTIRTVPSTFEFAPRLSDDGLGGVMEATPFDPVIDISDPIVNTSNEIESVKEQQSESVDEVEIVDQKRRRRLQKTKRQAEQKEEEQQKAVAACS